MKAEGKLLCLKRRQGDSVAACALLSSVCSTHCSHIYLYDGRRLFYPFTLRFTLLLCQPAYESLDIARIQPVE